MDDWLKRWILRIVVVVLVAFLLTMAWIVFDGTRDFYRSADCAVVVGGTLGNDGKPLPDMEAPLNQLAGSLKAGQVHAVVLACSESASGDPKSIMDALSRYLVQQGAPSEMMMEDAQGTAPETLAADVAAYMTKGNRTSVLVVANYADITRLKLAFRRAGVTQVFTTHTGSFQVSDLLAIAGTAFFLWQNVFEKDVAPEAQKLVGNVQGDAQGLVSKTTQTGEDSIKNQGDVPGMSNAPPAAPSTAASVAPLADGQTVNATGIGSFQVPRDWSQQIIFPILDPVWAPPGTVGQLSALIGIIKVNQPGSLANAISEITSDIGSEGFTGVRTLSQAPFTTAAGQDGIRLMVTVSKDSKTIELVIYAFAGRGDAKVALYGGSLPANMATNLPLFDSCAETLRIW